MSDQSELINHAIEEAYDHGRRAALTDAAKAVREDADVVEASTTSTKARRLLTVHVMRTIADNLEGMAK